MRYDSYAKNKFLSVKNAIGRDIFQIRAEASEMDANMIFNAQCGEEMLAQLKEKFKIATKKERMLILTTLPRSWNMAKIVEHFEVTPYMAKAAKHLQSTKGILSVPEAKLGPTRLSDEVVEIAKQFYRDDEFSQVCPGKKDYKFVTENGEKRAMQRRMVLFNLNEAHEAFKKKASNN